jgi:hypothetical protein
MDFSTVIINPSIEQCTYAINNIHPENDTELIQPSKDDVLASFSLLEALPEMKICVMSESDYVYFFLYLHYDGNYYKIRQVDNTIEAFHIFKETYLETTPKRTNKRSQVSPPIKPKRPRMNVSPKPLVFNKIDFESDLRIFTHPESIIPALDLATDNHFF